MSEHEKVHVICENLCLEEGMTKGQIQELVGTVASGSPKGVYATSAAIKTANPDTGVYIASGNGHIYSWTKNQSGDPIDLGVYQAAEDSETVDQLRDAVDDLDKNVFSFERIEISDIEYERGGFINNSGGITNNVNFMYSDYIEVREGQEIEYSINAYNSQVISISAWKSDKSMVLSKSVFGNVSSANLLTGVYTVPKGIKYIRITRWATSIGNNDSANIPLIFSKVDEAASTANIVNEFAHDLIVERKSQNIYDENATGVERGFYLNAQGEKIESSLLCISDFIKIENKNIYSRNILTLLPVNFSGCYYDKNKNYISGITASRAENADWFLTPHSNSGAYYVRLNFSNTYKTNMFIKTNADTFPSSYIEFYDYTTARDDILLNQKQLEQATAELLSIENNWKGKIWHAFGTSITNTSAEGKYVPYLAEMAGMTFINHGSSGGCIATKSGSSANSQIISQIDAASLTNADLVTIEGFVNDWNQAVPIGEITDTTVETLCGAIYQAITKLLSKTNATIVFITDHTGTSYNNRNVRRNVTRNGKIQDDYREATIKMCKYMNIPVIDAGRKCMISENTENPYLIDQIHHTELGGKQFAKTIWSELKDIAPRITNE